MSDLKPRHRQKTCSPLHGFAWWGVVLVLCIGGDVDAQSRAAPKSDATTSWSKRKEQADAKLVRFARQLLGVDYNFGGRLGTKTSRRREGIDCQGVLFYALERAYPRCDWRSYSVMPTKAIARKELGAVVAGFGPSKTADVDVSKLRPGDFIWFVGDDENPAEGAIGTLDGRPVWVWHTAMYSGEGNFIVGDHYAGKAVEEPLVPYLKRHQDAYLGILVTRLDGKPNPRRCRRGQKLPSVRR